MVNYCCVYGCGRNNKTSKHLYYYSLPKERHRLVQWLEALGRVDLLEKNPKKLTNRVCSRHFSPSSIKNKHLCADAVPTLSLSNNPSEGSNETDKQQSAHSNIICNSCNKSILGFRYKCITCADYDLCSKCEMLEAHDQHYLLRIPKPVNFTVANDLIKKWRQFFKTDNLGRKILFKEECSSDDDVPITKYARNYDSGIDLTEEEKIKIRDEVTRVLNIKHPDKREEEVAKRKQKLQKKKGLPKKKKLNELVEICVDTMELEGIAPEVVFADVNDIKGNQNLDVKDEILNTLTPLVAVPQMEHSMKLNDELSEFLIGVKYPDA